MHCFC